MAFLPSRVSL